ncbi:MAG: hypothetical protein ACI854_002670, partial [Arenicella sp.]
SATDSATDTETSSANNAIHQMLLKNYFYYLLIRYRLHL